MDGAWQVLDAPVIKEIDKATKSYYAVSSLIHSNQSVFFFLQILILETSNKKCQRKNEINPH